MEKPRVFPGIESVLEYLGFKEEITHYCTVLSKMELQGDNILKFVLSILNKKKKCLEKLQKRF